MKVYTPQLNIEFLAEPSIDPATMEKVDLQLPLEVNLQKTSFDLPPRNMLQRLWGRVEIIYKGLTRTNGRRQKQQEQKPQDQQQGQEKQQHGDKEDYMETKKQIPLASIYDAKPSDPVTTTTATNNTQAMKQTLPTQIPQITTKRAYSVLEVDSTKIPLVDTTNHDDTQQQQPSKKKLCKSVTKSVTTPDKQVFLYNSSTSTESARLNNRTNNSNNTIVNNNNKNDSSDSNSSGTLSGGGSINKSGDQRKKRKHLQLECDDDDGKDNNDLVVQQKIADSSSSSAGDSESTRRSMKRKRTTLYINWQTATNHWTAAATAQTKTEHDSQQFLIFNIPVVCFLVLFVFMFILYTSYFNPHPNPYFPF